MIIFRPLLALATALATALVLSAGLTACSVHVVDGDASSVSPSPADSTPSTPASGRASTPSASSADGSAATEADGVTRADLIDRATKVLRCDGELTITQDAVALRIEGPCDSVVLNSSGSRIVTDDVAHLEVIGDGTLVLTGHVQRLGVTGSANVVHWTGSTPAILDVGDGNIITAG